LTIARLLLGVHLSCALGAAVAFWVAARAFKGGPVHRAAGEWFRWLIYTAAATGGVLAFAADRETMWLVLYVLLIIVAPTHHGLAVVRAGPVPARVRSRVHAWLNVTSIVASAGFLGVVVAWQQWLALTLVPAGFVIGLRNLSYAGRLTVAHPDEWEREHLTSMLTAGITVHTALLVFGTSTTLGLELTGALAMLPWIAPAAIGLPVIAWLRTRRLSPDFLEEVDKK
jgi:hypothetical protein